MNPAPIHIDEEREAAIAEMAALAAERRLTPVEGRTLATLKSGRSQTTDAAGRRRRDGRGSITSPRGILPRAAGLP